MMENESADQIASYLNDVRWNVRRMTGA